MKALWCKLVGHKWRRRYFPSLDLEKHDCRRCKDFHWNDRADSPDYEKHHCTKDCFIEPVAW